MPVISRANYSFDNWRADGDDRDSAEVAATSPFRCDLLGCIGKLNGKTIAVIRPPRRSKRIAASPTSSSRRSASAKSTVAGGGRPGACCKPEGAHALYIEGFSIRNESVAETQG